MTPEQVARRALEEALAPLAETLDDHPVVRGIVASALMRLSKAAAEGRKPRRKVFRSRHLKSVWKGLGLLKESQSTLERARELGLRTGEEITQFLAEIVSS